MTFVLDAYVGTKIVVPLCAPLALTAARLLGTDVKTAALTPAGAVMVELPYVELNAVEAVASSVTVQKTMLPMRV